MRLQGIAEFCRAFARLLPCGDCTNHFLKELHTDFNPELQRWPTNYFEWTVDVRKRVARRVKRQERELCEVKPDFNAEWVQNAWFVLTIMGFSYPTHPMDSGFFDDVRFFFRVLPRLIPTAFIPELCTPILDKRGTAWCLTKTSFLETLLELRSAHANKFSLPPISTVEELQHTWLKELDKFVTEYKRRQENELSSQSSKTVDIVEKEDSEKQGDIQDNKPRINKPPLIAVSDVLREQKRQRKQERSVLASLASRTSKEINDSDQHHYEEERFTNSEAKPDREDKPNSEPAANMKEKPLPEDKFPEIIVLSDQARKENEHVFEDEFNDVDAPHADKEKDSIIEPIPAEQKQNAVLFSNLPNVAREETNCQKQKNKQGFQFCFSGKDSTGSYWIVWVCLIVIAALLLGMGAYSYATTPKLLYVREEESSGSLQKEKQQQDYEDPLMAK